MIRERIADDIYVFTSQRYAQVTAGAILTKEGAVLIDTLFYPEETKEIKAFVEGRLGLPVRYVINSHYHADHTTGNYLFPNARIIGHLRCRELLDSIGREGLRQMQAEMSEFQEVSIVLPEMVLEGTEMNLHIGGKHIRLQHMPGHSPDLISVYVINDQILFASDNVMPVPTIFDGVLEDLISSLHMMLGMQPECMVQGHGAVILRGEVERVLKENLDYLFSIRTKVEAAVAKSGTVDSLDSIDIESCGKSRIPLHGLVVDLHKANLYRLHRDLLERSHLS